MRNENVGEFKLLLQAHQQVQNLRLNRHVQRRDGFVADDELRAKGQRAGNADALALAAFIFAGFLMNNGYFATAANFLYNNF